MSGGACGKCRLVSSVLKRSQGELLGELRDRVIGMPWGWGMSLPSEGDRGFFPGIVRQRTLLRYRTLLLASKCCWILCRGWGVSTAWLDPHAQDHLSRIGGLAWLGRVRNGVNRCSLGLGDPPLECSAPWSVPARRSRGTFNRPVDMILRWSLPLLVPGASFNGIVDWQYDRLLGQ
ncbi:hypothetical protein BHE74_00022153 [Ensete ventricosum]|nr:hypothetical protein BHE74_00022153 [Ensete ventricosum]